MYNQTTKTYNYGNLFSITVCQNCFEYRIDHNPRLVFHGIDTKYLDAHKDGILTPKGEPDAPYYYHYLGGRFIHLGHLCITALLNPDPGWVWYGFDFKRIRKKYPDMKFLNQDVWDILSFHARSLPPRYRADYKNKLFLKKYTHEDPHTCIMLDELDCRLANAVVAKKIMEGERACQFVRKKLEIIIFEDAEQIEADNNNGNNLEKQISCNCNINNCSDVCL